MDAGGIHRFGPDAALRTVQHVSDIVPSLAFPKPSARRISVVASAKKSSPTWSDVKAALTIFDRAGLQGLLQDLYAASKDNQAFIHARLGLGHDPLKPYKAIISRWICPDVMKNEPISVAKAKKAISDYKKAIGRPEGLAELSVFYCEEVFIFLDSCGMDDESYFMALVRMFEQALKLVFVLPLAERTTYLERLDKLRSRGKNIGWGVKEDFDCLWFEAGLGVED